MTAITISQFQGSVPRTDPEYSQKTAASYAEDCKFESGALDSFREPLLVRELEEGFTKTYLHNCCWHDFKGCVDVAYGSVGCKEIFVTGLEEYPVMITCDDDCNTKAVRLGVPCPVKVPSVFAGPEGDTTEDDFEGRSYAYQYETSFGWRSQLSPASKAINAKDGQTFVISGWEVPDSSWDVTKVNIYRTVVGSMQSGNEKGNEPDSVWMLVASIDISEVSYTDSALNESLWTSLEEDIVLPPPEDLKGITWVESSNCLFGYVGNRLYTSENHNYHNWPNYFDLDDNICGIAESGGMIYVVTDGRPYVLKASADCKSASCREIARLHGSFPMVGCGNRQVATVAGGVVYPSHKGLVALSGANQPIFITWPLYSEEQWQRLLPDTILPVEVDGKLFCFGKGGSFYMKLSRGPENGWNLDVHSNLSDTNVSDAFVTRNGQFFIVKDGKQYEWDRGNDIRPHKFISKEFKTPNPTGYGFGLVDFTFGEERVIIELDNKKVLDRDCVASREFRLPMHAVGRTAKITLIGTGKVTLASIASSSRELST